ncbi:hypothetical protein GH714_036635 [Hevea brasiliensis]|uniref:Retrotransposon gag domain-containing protein n=1 Tax=Hevea brasiliensis TaxID=3981 RepID=A0A6A6NKI3_HEVBR|nr:hypothetical protein GH714_036635 [Hevea brasiliensis]
MSGSTGTEQPTINSSQAAPTGKKGREKSRDFITALEERLTHLEGIVSEQRDRSDLDVRLIELESKGDEVELRAEMQGALNIAVDVLSKKDQAMEAILLVYREKVDKLEEELALCKTVLVSEVGTSGVAHGTSVDAPRPKAYDSARNAREIDNFLWNVERYFEAVGITEDAVKLHTVPLYLGDVATVWWRRHSEDIKKGTCTISTWGEFTKELKRQFYPENAESEARAKLRRLQHKEGAIQEYRRGVQDLATAMAAAESLIEFKRKEPSKDKGKKPDRGHKTRGGDKSKQARTTGGTKGRGTRLRRKKVSLLEPNLLALSAMGLIEHLSVPRGASLLPWFQRKPNHQRRGTLPRCNCLVQSRPRLRNKTKAECW